MITLRTIDESLLTSILSIEEQAHSHPWSKANILSAIASKRTTVMGAFFGEQLAGYAVFDCVIDEASLQNLSVHPKFQRKGIGRQLVQSIFEEYPQTQHVFLEVRISNKPAIALYEAMEFAELGVRPNYYPSKNGGKEDALLMALSRID
ncbi:MAG: ribosomal protein S18-alanine N-acetyltransferase [Gammaproteobacteria bacterium]|nr:ribosomal protein S18-alanine N-acetyltransferase [Gammaproteobacteria bacterium]